MSTPSSSALVETTPRISPSRRPVLDGPALRGQVAAAVAPDAAARAVALPERLAQTGEQQLDRDPRPTEDDRLAAGAQEGEGPTLRQRHGRSTRAARGLQDRRVHEQHVAFAGRGAVPVHQPRRSPGQHRGELAGFPIVAEQHTMIGLLP